jgi:hypothetical protein
VFSSLPRASASQPQNSYRGSPSTIKLTPRQTLPSPAQNSTPTWRRTLFSSAPSTLSALATLHLHSAPSAVVRNRYFVIPPTCATHNLRCAHQSILRYPLLTCPHQFYGIRHLPALTNSMVSATHQAKHGALQSRQLPLSYERRSLHPFHARSRHLPRILPPRLRTASPGLRFTSTTEAVLALPLNNTFEDAYAQGVLSVVKPSDIATQLTGRSGKRTHPCYV